jgi:hypothetical protein
MGPGNGLGKLSMAHHRAGWHQSSYTSQQNFSMAHYPQIPSQMLPTYQELCRYCVQNSEALRNGNARSRIQVEIQRDARGWVKHPQKVREAVAECEEEGSDHLSRKEFLQSVSMK